MNRCLILLFIFTHLSCHLVAQITDSYPKNFEQLAKQLRAKEINYNAKNPATPIFLEDSSHCYTWDTTLLKWSDIPLLKTYIDHYDSSNHKLNFRVVSWQDSTYQNSVITNYVYDSTGKLSEAHEFANSFGTWVLNKRVLYSYTPSGRLQEELNQEFAQGGWLDKRKTIYSYDSFMNVAKIETRNWDTTYWRPVSRDTFAYTASQLLASKVSQNFQSGNWVNDIKFIYNYNGLTLDKLFIQEWNQGSNNWDYILRHVYTYDASGNLLVDLTQLFISFTNWSNYIRETRTFNATNQELTFLLETRQSNQWHFYGKRNQTYTINGSLQSVTNKTGNGWSTTITDADSTVYFYHQLTALQELQTQSNLFEIRPNPAKDELYFKVNTDAVSYQISLYDSQAKLCLLMESQSKDWQQISLEQMHLKPGIYYCQLSSGARIIANQKIVLIND